MAASILRLCSFHHPMSLAMGCHRQILAGISNHCCTTCMEGIIAVRSRRPQLGSLLFSKLKPTAFSSKALLVTTHGSHGSTVGACARQSNRFQRFLNAEPRLCGQHGGECLPLLQVCPCHDTSRASGHARWSVQGCMCSAKAFPSSALETVPLTMTSK